MDKTAVFVLHAKFTQKTMSVREGGRWFIGQCDQKTPQEDA